MSELASESMAQRLRPARERSINRAPAKPAERSESRAMSGNVNEAAVTILGEAAHG
jgi:hypothetical protein